AIIVFQNSAKLGSGEATVNNAALDGLIALANAIKNAVVIGGDPGQYPQNAVDTFGGAISAAQTVSANASATQADIDSAATALQTAIIVFQNSANLGSGEAAVNNAALDGLIALANAIKNNAVIGGDPGQYQQNAVDTFEGAISAAQAVSANASATQADIDSAATALQAAIIAFQNSVNDGSSDIGGYSDYTGGDGGCDAGAGLAGALVLLAGIAATRMRKRKRR
ncbi:MAG: FIVAR domain-containing protein, partial [Synergistaceae bacterium]|nr:FIVAR domain-containing protein [Synergistaceae bacterium]